MSFWKRLGIVIAQYKTDHEPQHVHIFEDGKRAVTFNIDEWKVIKGKLTPKARKALEVLRKEGTLCATHNSHP